MAYFLTPLAFFFLTINLLIPAPWGLCQKAMEIGCWTRESPELATLLLDRLRYFLWTA
jgi:hypothetical protein